ALLLRYRLKDRPGDPLSGLFILDVLFHDVHEDIDEVAELGMGLGPDLLLGLTVEGEAASQALTLLRPLDHPGDLVERLDRPVFGARLDRLEELREDNAPHLKVLLIE